MTATRKHKLNVSFNPHLKTHLKSSDWATWLRELPFIKQVWAGFSPVSHLYHTRTPNILWRIRWTLSQSRKQWINLAFQNLSSEGPPISFCPSAFRAHYWIFAWPCGTCQGAAATALQSPADSPASLLSRREHINFSLSLNYCLSADL